MAKDWSSIEVRSMGDVGGEIGFLDRVPAGARDFDETRGFRWLQPGELIDIPMPSTAIELDCLLRHIEIDADFGDWAKAAVHLAEAKTVWDLLEGPLVLKTAANAHLRNAERAAGEMPRLLACMAHAIGKGARRETGRLASLAIVAVEWIEQALF
jgi:hypothetical protein